MMMSRQLTINVKEFCFGAAEGDHGFREGGRYYAKLLVDDEEMLRTEKALKTKAMSAAKWNQMFEISMSENSRVSLEVFKARKFLADRLIGSAECKLDGLFKLLKAAEEDTYQTTATYDETDSSGSEIEEEESSCELKQKPIFKADNGKSTFEVVKDGKKKGLLCLSLSLTYNNVVVVGAADKWNLVMRHEDFDMISVHYNNNEDDQVKQSKDHKKPRPKTAGCCLAPNAENSL